jgi:hypothetical protein
MTRSVPAAAGVTLLAMALLAAAVRVQAARERYYPAAAADEDALYVTSGSTVRRLTGAFNPLAADVYWLRAIQYFGGTKRRIDAVAKTAVPRPPLEPGESDEYRELYPLLDITTSLDPRFNIAYRFGAVFLAAGYPGGPGRPDLAIKLLEKGLRERPDKWEYMQDIGFVHYWYRHDYKAAAEWFDKAARTPGAPWFLKSLAAVTLAEGGDRRSSRVMWEAIRQSADNDWLRQDADRRLVQLRAFDQIDELQSVIDRVAAATGARPADWKAVIRSQGWPGVPVDPAGTPYELTPDGVVRTSSSSPLWPMPAEPQHMANRPLS